jgi:FkbM family methyltransferase
MTELIDFSIDTENAEKNYNLAVWYEKQGQVSPAHTYYLRSAERSENDALSYNALIRSSLCYRAQSSRDNTEKIVLENALTLNPNRPEAYYFLSLLYEHRKDWQNCYIYSTLGLNLYENFIFTTSEIPEYKGRAYLQFQKAVSAWWWGRGMESRRLLHSLVNNYWNELDEGHRAAVERNITSLGSGPESIAFVPYKKDLYSELRYKFPWSSTIERNFSQVCQDMFILSMLDGKRNGTFVEIGGAHPFKGNNTALLEKSFAWTGISVEYDQKFIEGYRANRSANLLHANALELDYKQVFQQNFGDAKVIDYLQLDIEPARNTYDCMLRIPFDEYKFAVITYEHDHYVDISRTYRKKSRDFLHSKGYVLVVNDISPEGICNFEDWWVHPDLIKPETLVRMTSIKDGVHNVREYFYPSQIEPKFYAYQEMDRYIRENYFPDYDYKGVLVEVGAGPPEFISNSKHFRDSGWRTICIDPNPKFVAQHIEVGSEIYPYACSNFEGKSTFTINTGNDGFYLPENDGVSYSALDIRYDGVPEHHHQEIINVDIKLLNTILESAKVNKIDVLSIDVEGWELEVLQGFDSIKYSPKVIVIENLEKNVKYEQYLNNLGYVKKIELDGNEIYEKNIKPIPPIYTLAKSTPTAIVVDNFYEHPDEIREFALKQDYVEGGFGRGFIGRRTEQQFLFSGLKERFEQILGKKITKWEDHGMNGRFQIAWSGEPLVYHCDDQRWGGMIYLTPNAPYQCGTTLYAHKQTRARSYYDEGWDAAWKDIPGDPHLDGTSFESVDVIGNVYNRLVIFDASNIHSASQYFGTVAENSRLWQMFFWDSD